jgi:hypothetical protein
LGKAYTFDPSLCGSLHTLPAEILNLKGYKDENTIQLGWITGNEATIDAYILEKSVDATYYTTMAYVFAKGGSDHNTYSMIDYHPGTINYYRVRAVRKDNSYAYSSIVKIKTDNLITANVAVAPNPVISNFKLKLSGFETGVYTIEMKNSSGQLIQRKNIAVSGQEFSENMTRLTSMPTGIYYLNVYDQANKLVKTIKLLAK